MSELSLQGPLSTYPPQDQDPPALSEAQLRQLYDDEEVERFLSSFSAYVREVRLSSSTTGTESNRVDSSASATEQSILTALPRLPPNHSLSQHIAHNYLLPHLPPATSVTPAFTLKRLTLTTQRLYLAAFPLYQVFLLDLARLALWKDFQRSLRHCIIFWFLWFHDLLLSAVIFRMVFGLLRRRLTTYPTLRELQKRREETAQALKFGEALQQRLTATTLGPIDIWRLFKLYRSGGKGPAVASIRSDETDEEENLKRDLLQLLSELADLHERIKNIFTWRRENVSRRYLLLLIIIGIGTFILPAQLIAKSIYCIGGMLFWHVTPVVAALPREDRIRALLLFRDAPTDADYAMEMITKRIATGQDVDVTSLRQQLEPRHISDASTSTPDDTRTLSGESSGDDVVNWKKWSERVVRGKAFVEDSKRIVSVRTSQDQVVAETASMYRLETEDANTFLAQYASSPGLITLTSSTLFFTTLTKTHAKLVIPRERLRGVRRSGLMKGITVTWIPEGSTEGEAREDKFHWVGNLTMFFSPDLLSKRDSGFGLLWLAATLGSKSAFKKLPKRSVMTADISQLCRLIATPAEPLALRLSSNLLVGAARVYRIKQEIFVSDVTTCFNSLKRVEHEFRSLTSSEGQLQMAQPSVKSSAVTLRADPRAAFSLEFDAMITNWDEYLNPEGHDSAEDEAEDEYHPTAAKTKRKAKTSNLEVLRATACTLPETHNFLLTSSFDASFGGNGATMHSSSQIGGFAFDDTFDGLDIGEGVGDDLVRELGEGWGVNLTDENVAENLPQPQEAFDIHFDTGEFDGVTGFDDPVHVAQSPQPHSSINLIQNTIVETVEPQPSPSLVGTTMSTDFQAVVPNPRSPPDENTVQDVCAGGPAPPEEKRATSRKNKRARLVLDVRTELTDEELKATRMYYLDKQNVIRCELEIKRFEKEQAEQIRTLLWDAPGSVHAKELAEFWVDHFKAHVEARCGLLVDSYHSDRAPPQKRRKISITPIKSRPGDVGDKSVMSTGDWRTDRKAHVLIDGGEMADFNYDIEANWGDVDEYTPNTKYLRSSEEPGQARRVSQSPPAFDDNFGVDVPSNTFHSQRSALFPWDMAGGSSSISARAGEMQLLSGDRMCVEQADARLRGSSASRRGSSLPSFPGNLQAGIGSPAVISRVVQSDDDFVFDVPGNNDIGESLQSEASRVALEKNSHNFLEYAKMQYKSLPSTTQYLAFDDVVPRATSTARVAAAALYHCLVLATKDLMRVNQGEPYGRIDIRII
ncbi:hypothetical protein JVU11DRAFT_5141 [Chiua virens]|nr:hypothetical protein JVU11DRAFT_5141 [Chiua virens]